MIGQTISHYRITAKLGEGGMGVVYQAEDTKLGRTVALKFLPAELTRDPEAKARFVQEARAASGLDHPNVCTIHEIDETDDGQMFIAMSCYDGETLKERIGRGPLPQDEATGIARQIAEGLAKAHAQGIVHRDIKPANIFLTTDGLVKIVDFGVAKLKGQAQLTRVGTTLGTAAYMSPEQARGEEVDHRTDIWSLGVVLYEMIVGRPPFRGEHEQAVIYSLLNTEPAAMVGVTPDLERVVGKALARPRERRYQQMGELSDDLQAGRLAVPPSAKKWSPFERFFVAGGLVALVALLVVIGLQKLGDRKEVIDSLAVLPLENLSGDPEQEYFADGMTELLIGDLARIGSLRVISRTSVMRYKETSKSLPEIAAELDVDAIVEGTVFWEGDMVRITAQLIHVPTDRHLWADRFQRDLSNALNLQSEVARAIAGAIEVQLTPQEQGHLAEVQPVAPEVQEAYLKGRYNLGKITPEGAWQAMEYFEAAVAQDSTYAPAIAGIAECWFWITQVYVQIPYREGFPRARAAAEQALRLDDTIGEAHSVRGLVLAMHDWNFPEAERAFRRAREVNPGSALCHWGLGAIFVIRGHFDEGLAIWREALEIDPFSLGTRVGYGEMLYHARRYDQSIAEHLKILELDPEFEGAFAFLLYTYIAKGMYEEAIATKRKEVLLAGGSEEWVDGLAQAYTEAGQRGYWQYRLDSAERRLAQQKYLTPIYMAEIHAALDNKDEAFAWLDSSVAARVGDLVFLKVTPEWDNLRGDPRFDALLEKVGLSP